MLNYLTIGIIGVTLSHFYATCKVTLLLSILFFLYYKFMLI